MSKIARLLAWEKIHADTLKLRRVYLKFKPNSFINGVTYTSIKSPTSLDFYVLGERRRNLKSDMNIFPLIEPHNYNRDIFSIIQYHSYYSPLFNQVSENINFIKTMNHVKIIMMKMDADKRLKKGTYYTRNTKEHILRLFDIILCVCESEIGEIELSTNERDLINGYVESKISMDQVLVTLLLREENEKEPK